MKIAITGSSGLIGQALSQALEARGDQVVRLKHGRDWQWCPTPNQSPWVNTELLAQADAVIHLAGQNIAQGRWTPHHKRVIRDSRVLGTQLIASALADLPKSQRPMTLISASAVGYYGHRPGEILDESATAGHGFLPQTSIQWEQATLPAQQAGIRVVHPRISMVLAHQGGAFAKMIPAFKLGLGGRLGDGRQMVSWITLTDAIAALLFLLDTPYLHGPCNLATPQAVTNREFTAALASALHRPAFLPAPAWLLKLALGEMAPALLLASQQVTPKALLDAKFAFKWPSIEEGLKEILKQTK